MAVSKGGDWHISGKVGPVIYARWKGIDYMRSRPKQSSKAPSLAQLRHRQKWRVMSKFIGEARLAVNEGFKRAGTSRKTAMNVALAYNARYAIKDGANGPEIDFSKIILSSGILPAPFDVKVETYANAFLITWSPAITSSMLSGKDIAVITLYDAEREYGYVRSTAYREAGRYKYEILSDTYGHAFHIYLFFITKNGHSSPSLYLGEFKAEA